MQETYKAVELSCISGRSKSGRSKLGRNGDGKGVIAPSVRDSDELKSNKDKKKTVIAHRAIAAFFCPKIERRMRMNVREQADRAGLL